MAKKIIWEKIQYGSEKPSFRLREQANAEWWAMVFWGNGGYTYECGKRNDIKYYKNIGSRYKSDKTAKKYALNSIFIFSNQ